MSKDNPNWIYVFATNEQGLHNDGNARIAYKDYGARMGFSYGHWGRSFAIPTKDQQLRPLSLLAIRGYVEGFLSYALGHPELTFQVTRIGTGLAGLSYEVMAKLFDDCPNNCLFDEAWKPWLPRNAKFWNTF